MKKILGIFAALMLSTTLAIATTTTTATTLSNFEQGQKLVQENEYASAIEYFDKAILEDPKNVDAYLERGVAKAELDKYESAIEDFNKAIELAPANSDAYLGRAAVYSEIGYNESSFKDLNKAVELNPCVKTYSSRALNYIEQKDFVNARKDIASARAIEPKNGGLYTLEMLIDLKERNWLDAFWHYLQSKRYAD